MTPPPQPRAGRPKAPVDENTIGGRLQRLREDSGLTQAELEERLGVSRTQISKYERNDEGGRDIPDHVVRRAAMFFGVTPSWLRYGDTESRLIRVSGRVGAGGHIEAVAYDTGRHVEIPASWGDATALQIDGDSCWPLYDDRDVIVIRGDPRMQESEFLNRMCVAETEDGRGLAKRIRRGSGPGLYTLESLNAPPIEDVRLVSARPVRMHLSL